MKKPLNVRHYFIASLLVTFFLFFIDEGYYDFRWMKDPGNWLVFAFYVAFLFGGQLLVGGIFLAGYRGKYKTAISTVVGSMLGFILFVGFLYLKGFNFSN